MNTNPSQRRTDDKLRSVFGSRKETKPELSRAHGTGKMADPKQRQPHIREGAEADVGGGAPEIKKDKSPESKSDGKVRFVA